MSNNVIDLRSALELLKKHKGQLIETDVPADPNAEICGIYRYIGAAGTIMRPTKIDGPAMIFNNVKGYPGSRVVIGIMCSRKRVALLLGVAPDKIGKLVTDALENPIPNVMVKKAACQEVVYKATDKGFDVLKLLPMPTNTPEDAGPFITLGLVYGKDPDTGQENAAVHRMCIQGKDEISIYYVPGRHLDVMRQKYEKAGKAMPVSVNMGLDPAIFIASCFSAPTAPMGYDELTIAAAMRKKATELVQCVSVDAKAIANAEIVIEGEVLPEVRVAEDQHTKTGKAMPELPGYTGSANPAVPVLKVKAVTTRKDPYMQTCVGPSDEMVNMAGIPTEASIMQMVNNALPGLVKNVYAPRFGGGKYVAIMQVNKRTPPDEGRHRQAALIAFAVYSELKHVILVDDDVDPFDIDDVMWAMTTRFQSDVDVVSIPGVRCHPLDPSSDPSISPSIRGKGIAAKTIFDCTVPFDQKARFKRSAFMELDPKPYAPKGYFD